MARRIALALALALTSSFACAVIAQDPVRKKVAATGSITGRVTDALGEVVPMANVAVLGSRDRDRVLARGLTDAAGMFVIRGVPLDDTPCPLDVVSEGRRSAPVLARLSESVRECSVEVRLWDAADVDVKVVGEDGRPLADATVFAKSAFDRLFLTAGPQVEARTDATGRARLHDVPIGAIVVGAWCPGHDLANTSLRLARGAGVEFQLARADGVRIDLAVSGLQNGVEADWQLGCPSGDGPLLPRSLVRGTTRGGTATIEGLPDAKWMLRFFAPGHGLSPSQVELEAASAEHVVRATAVLGEAIPAGAVEMPVPGRDESVASSARVHGMVRDADGRPVPGAFVRLECANDAIASARPPRFALADRIGRYVLSKVDSGCYRLAVAVDDDDSWGTGEVLEVMPETDVERDLRFGR